MAPISPKKLRDAIHIYLAEQALISMDGPLFPRVPHFQAQSPLRSAAAVLSHVNKEKNDIIYAARERGRE